MARDMLSLCAGKKAKKQHGKKKSLTQALVLAIRANEEESVKDLVKVGKH